MALFVYSPLSELSTYMTSSLNADSVTVAEIER